MHPEGEGVPSKYPFQLCVIVDVQSEVRHVVGPLTPERVESQLAGLAVMYPDHHENSFTVCELVKALYPGDDPDLDAIFGEDDSSPEEE